MVFVNIIALNVSENRNKESKGKIEDSLEHWKSLQNCSIINCCFIVRFQPINMVKESLKTQNL